MNPNIPKHGVWTPNVAPKKTLKYTLPTFTLISKARNRNSRAIEKRDPTQIHQLGGTNGQYFLAIQMMKMRQNILFSQTLELLLQLPDLCAVKHKNSLCNSKVSKALPLLLLFPRL